MSKFLSLINRLFLALKFGGRLIIHPQSTIPWNTTFIIDDDSLIKIAAGVKIRDMVELRATRKSELTIEKGVKLDRLVRIIATNETYISIGENTRIGQGSIVNGGGNVEIGQDTLISGYVYIQTSMHNHKAAGNIIENGYIYNDVVVGAGCWLGAHSVVFPGVCLGARVVVGSNAVVSKSFPSGSVIGGIPAGDLK